QFFAKPHPERHYIGNKTIKRGRFGDRQQHDDNDHAANTANLRKYGPFACMSPFSVRLHAYFSEHSDFD
ncbi:MAG: hypothetical protein IJB41_04110, partial [Clostridia bacterium]|nr:hypothetical protein [Clostridia bacterium]